MEIIDGTVSYYNGFLKYDSWRGGRDFFAEAIGKEIHIARLQNDELVIKFKDRTGIAIRDDGQSCCEHRYMECADDLHAVNGAVLLGAELKDTRELPDDECHEVQFLEIITSKGSFNIASHNEHNGYYGGFDLTCGAV